MVTVVPCLPTTGKVDLVLKDVFKFSRLIGTFPIDYDYSAISTSNLAKGVILHLSSAAIGVLLVYGVTSDESILLSEKLMCILQIIPPIMFYWIYLARIIRNKWLLKEVYDELKDIEYHMWKNGVNWCYKPNWFSKYLSVTANLISSMLWDAVDGYQNPNYMVCYLIHTTLIAIVTQYANLLHVLTSILRDIRMIEDSKSVIKLTDKLFALCEKVMTVYEPQICLYIIVIYLFLLFTIYIMFIIVENMISIDVIWMMSFMSPLVQIVLHVTVFSKEVKKTNKMLYRRLLYNLDDETLQFHLVAKRDIVFTAGGFFILENTLICTMITTGINYLVFFLQYM
ncbi:Gustatory receptor 119h [Halyomorpha halys]|nr:Gustatory receptor 119h [Halyomorpha halys]